MAKTKLWSAVWSVDEMSYHWLPIYIIAWEHASEILDRIVGIGDDETRLRARDGRMIRFCSTFTAVFASAEGMYAFRSKNCSAEVRLRESPN